jgi:hypothetical protein
MLLAILLQYVRPIPELQVAHAAAAAARQRAPQHRRHARLAQPARFAAGLLRWRTLHVALRHRRDPSARDVRAVRERRRSKVAWLGCRRWWGWWRGFRWRPRPDFTPGAVCQPRQSTKPHTRSVCSDKTRRLSVAKSNSVDGTMYTNCDDINIAVAIIGASTSLMKAVRHACACVL